MIPEVKKLKLVALYFYICHMYDSELKYICQRFSNNHQPAFTDQEVLTIYLYVMHAEKRFKVKQIYDFASEYLRSWFPLLPSYEAFDMRINRLGEALKHLASQILSGNCPDSCNFQVSLLDSLPIITCSGKRTARVAKEITDKGYCSTKSMYYYGLKLHALAYYHPHHLPFPESIVVTPASENDLNVYKQNWSDITNRFFYGDKIYNHSEFFTEVMERKNFCHVNPHQSC